MIPPAVLLTIALAWIILHRYRALLGPMIVRWCDDLSGVHIFARCTIAGCDCRCAYCVHDHRHRPGDSGP